MSDDVDGDIPQLLQQWGLPQYIDTFEEGGTEEDIQWLQNCTEPWHLVEEKWHKTAKYRLKELETSENMTIEKYMNKYPVLKTPRGHDLLTDDFRVLYPSAENKIYETFPTIKRKIFKLALSKSHVPEVKDILELLQLLNKDNENYEEIESILAFMLLPLLLGNPTHRTKKQVWRPSKAEVKDGFITHVLRPMDVQVAIAHRQRNTLKMSAAETLCFVRYFGLLVGDLVPGHDAIWNIYICLRKIMDIVMSTVINKSDSDLLKSLTSEHNFLYLKYSKKFLTPKFHYLTHYPKMLLKFGPLVNIWSMRYEAKHRISKLYANVTNNRINICKSLAIKHQLQLNNKFISNTFMKQSIVCGRKKTVSDSRIIENIVCQLQLESTSLYKCNWVQVNGIKYTANMTLTLDFYEDKLLPKFGLIENIFITDDYVVIFECSLFDTLCFNEHLYCFDVELLSDRNTYVLGNIVSYVPNNLTLSVDGKHYYVTPRSSI